MPAFVAVKSTNMAWTPTGDLCCSQKAAAKTWSPFGGSAGSI
jgi:hypothetical protein